MTTDVSIGSDTVVSDGNNRDRASRWAPFLVGALALVPTLLSIEVASIPGGHLAISVVAAGLWGVVILLWLGLLLSPVRHLSRWSWSIVPVLFGLTLALSVSTLPLAARFAVSRAAFERLPDLGLSYDESVLAGLYTICCFEQFDSGYQFGVTEGPDAVWGFAYSPTGPPAGAAADGLPIGEGETEYRHLDGPWYIYRFQFDD